MCCPLAINQYPIYCALIGIIPTFWSLVYLFPSIWRWIHLNRKFHIIFVLFFLSVCAVIFFVLHSLNTFPSNPKKTLFELNKIAGNGTKKQNFSAFVCIGSKYRVNKCISSLLVFYGHRKENEGETATRKWPEGKLIFIKEKKWMRRQNHSISMNVYFAIGFVWGLELLRYRFNHRCSRTVLEHLWIQLKLLHPYMSTECWVNSNI